MRSKGCRIKCWPRSTARPCPTNTCSQQNWIARVSCWRVARAEGAKGDGQYQSMYSLDEINEALEKDKLSDALYKMERFAREHGLTDLAAWCSWELNGYPSG